MTAARSVGPEGAPRVVAIVQARMGSSRLPGKVLELAGGKTLLEQLVVRLRRVSALADVCIATTDRPADDAVVVEARRLGVASFRGSEADVLARFHGAAVATGAEVVVRVTADCPLLDPDEVQRVVAAFVERWPMLDYASNQDVGERRVPHGEVVEVFSRAALERAFHCARQAHHREHVTPFFYEAPGRFRTASVHPAFAEDLSSLRLTVDTPEDLALVRAVFGALGDAPGATGILAVARFLAAHPEVASGNAQVVQRSFREISPVARGPVVEEPLVASAPSLLVLRADAGAAAGGGHVSRALALGQAWRGAGGAAVLVTSGLPGRLRTAAAAAGLELVDLPSGAPPGSERDARAVADLVARRGAHAVVVDGYDFAPEYLEALRAPTHVTAYIEDHGAEPPADVLVRPRPAAQLAGASPSTASRPAVLDGAEHVIVRAPIAHAPRVTRAFTPPLRLLLTFGAADPAALAAPALAAARAVAARVPLSITLLVGDLATGSPAAEDGVRVLAGVDDMAGLLAETDLAVAAAGVTAWELACSGVPALVTWVADNQRPVAEAIAAAGAGWNLGPAAALDAASLESALERVVAAGPSALGAASDAGTRLVDGRGAERIARALERVYEGEP